MKKLLKWLFILGGIILAGYGIYRVYDYAVDVATKRIKKGAEEGIVKGVGNIVNPIKWFKRK